MARRRLPLTDPVVLNFATTRWALERLQHHAESGRYPSSLSACIDEILREALRAKETPT